MADFDEIANVVKRGETCIEVILHRTPVGVTVQVKAVPLVEEFMRNLGQGEKVSVAASGRYWQPLKKDQNLVAYVVAGIKGPNEGARVTVEALGQPLIIPDPRAGGETINLSYLRLVGISEGAGVSFGMKGVYSLDALKKLRDKISVSARDFYIEYLRPIDLSVKVVTQELQL